ncbi:MAG: hypothetical protein DRP63_01230, partial [Planctomycetota bacterium]
PGISLQDGVLTGKPTQSGLFRFVVEATSKSVGIWILNSSSSAQAATFVAEATSDSATYTKEFLLLVRTVEFREGLAAAVRDQHYSVAVYTVAFPDAASFNWSIQDPAQTNPGETAGLPPGISFQNGVLTGTPTQSGLFRFVVKATSGSATYSKKFLLVVRTFEWARKVLGSADTGNSAPRCCATPDGTTYAVWLHDNAGTKQLVYAKKPEQVDAVLEAPFSAASADDVTACDIIAGKDTLSNDAAIIAWLNTANSLNIAYSTDTSAVAHPKDINTSDADIKLFYINNTLYAAYAARGTTSGGISLWQPVADTTEAVASGTYNNLTGVAVSGMQKPVLAATGASDAYVFWYDGQQWRRATCPRSQGDADRRDDVSLAAGSSGQVWVFWARGGKIEAALFNPADGTFSDIVSVCDGVWVEATASAFVEGNVWLVVGFDDGGVTEAKWVTFNGVDVVEKELADYTPPIDGKQVEGVGLGMASEDDVLLVMAVDGEVRWMMWTAHAWSYPQAIPPFNQSNKCYWPIVLQASNGRLFALWSEGEDPWDTNKPCDIYLSIYDGQWSTPINVSNTHMWSGHVDAVLDSNGQLHFVWYDYDSTTKESRVYYGTYHNNNLYTENVTSSYNYATWPSIALDSTGQIHIFYRGKNPAGVRLAYHTSGVPGNWSPREQISFKPDGSDPEDTAYVRGVWIDNNDHIYAVWGEIKSSATDKGPYYTDNVSGSWCNGILLESIADSKCHDASIVIADGHKLVVWRNATANRIRWTMETASGWLPAMDVASIPSCYQPFMSTDGHTVALTFLGLDSTIAVVFSPTNMNMRNMVISSGPVLVDKGFGYVTSSGEATFWAAWVENHRIVYGVWR